VAETMAIQSLPAWFCLPDDMPLTHKFKVIGNGVPYLMALGIARTVNEFLNQIFDEVNLNG
jgi:DNA (cytosine-5)-methyltransferase 1